MQNVIFDVEIYVVGLYLGNDDVVVGRNSGIVVCKYVVLDIDGYFCALCYALVEIMRAGFCLEIAVEHLIDLLAEHTVADGDIDLAACLSGVGNGQKAEHIRQKAKMNAQITLFADAKGYTLKGISEAFD